MKNILLIPFFWSYLLFAQTNITEIATFKDASCNDAACECNECYWIFESADSEEIIINATTSDWEIELMLEIEHEEGWVEITPNEDFLNKKFQITYSISVCSCEDYHINNSYKTGTKIELIQDNESNEIKITVKYLYTEFGDYPHIVFEDSEGNTWDFGEGEHNFKSYDFGQNDGFVTNEDLVGSMFEIKLKKGRMKTYAEDGETVIEVDTYLIEDIKRI